MNALLPLQGGDMQFVTEMFKRSPEYRVEATDGTVVARAHCVSVPANLFSINDGRPGINIKPEAEAVAFLKGLCAASR